MIRCVVIATACVDITERTRNRSPVAKRKLPIGIQIFRTVREGGYYCVDKTAYVRQLVKEGTHYFLSRPQRFGRSLLVDTLKELFQGSEDLFRRLAIHPCWDLSARHPVLRLSFGAGEFGDVEGLRADA